MVNSIHKNYGQFNLSHKFFKNANFVLCTHSVMQWTRGKWRKVLQKYFRKILQRKGLAKYKILSETNILITDTGEK